MSTYAYVGGNPYSYADPTGEFAILGPMIMGALYAGLMDYALQAMLHGCELACISSAEVLTAAALGALGGINIVNLLSHMKYLDDLVKLTRVTKGIDDIFKSGRTPKASELRKYAADQGWTPSQTNGGPLKYVDENGIPRVTIKQGSSRAPGSGSPHVELKNASGQRIDPLGNPVTRKSPGNQTPIDFDI